MGVLLQRWALRRRQPQCAFLKNPMQKCTLSFKSFNYIYIKKSYQRICHAIAFWEIPLHFCSFVSEPTSRKRCTLLRSPHIHKKSREQFEWIRKKGGCSFSAAHGKHLLLLLFWLQNSQFPGVQLQITLKGRTTLPPSINGNGAVAKP